MARPLLKLSIKDLLVGAPSMILKVSTGPQRKRSDRPKVPRGLRGPSQNSHRATEGAIRQAQSAESVARASAKFAPRLRQRSPTTVSCETCAKKGIGRRFCRVRQRKGHQIFPGTDETTSNEHPALTRNVTTLSVATRLGEKAFGPCLGRPRGN